MVQNKPRRQVHKIHSSNTKAINLKSTCLSLWSHLASPIFYSPIYFTFVTSRFYEEMQILFQILF